MRDLPTVPASRSAIIQLVGSLAGSVQAFDQLEHSFAALSIDQLSRELLVCGIIPEQFAHDSSAEKLWAKLCDILLADTLRHLNIEATVLRARGDSADVFGKAVDYTLVGDAKAFRLSRTAKNQKDFKVSALDDWRRTNTFACLIAPLYQFPTNKSQIYLQAEQKNVTLLSYVHLKFLLDFSVSRSLISLWQTPATLTPATDASRYWEAVEQTILAITGKDAALLLNYKTQEIEQTHRIGQESITYWQTVLSQYRTLSREEAIEKLIAQAGIDAKIRTIRRAITESRPL